jgi:hypothetical protein
MHDDDDSGGIYAVPGFSEKKVTLTLLIIFFPAGFIYWLTHLKQIKNIKENIWFFDHPFITWLIVYAILGFFVMR